MVAVTLCFNLGGLVDYIEDVENTVINIALKPAWYASPNGLLLFKHLNVSQKVSGFRSNPDFPEESTLASILIIKNILDVQLDCLLDKASPSSFKSTDRVSRALLNFVWQISVLW